MRRKWLSANKTKFLFKDSKFNSWLKKIMTICSFKRKNNRTGFARAGFLFLEFPTLLGLGKSSPWLFRVKKVKII